MNRPLPLFFAALTGLLALSTAAPADTVAPPSPKPLGTARVLKREPTRASLLEAVATTSLEADPPSAEVTPAPKPDEWKAASPVRLHHDVGACRAFRLHEWIKIHCDGFPAAGVSLLAGSRKDVALWVDQPKEPSEAMKTPRAVEVIFPVRRGDGRLFQIAQFGEGWDGPVAWNLAYSVSEQWVEGEAAPIITVR